jgi:hypothetical protein
MKTLILAPLFSLALAASAQAQCFADYKAKQDNPLRLQYGIVELPPSACASVPAAREYAAPVIARSGWTLLTIESIFGPADLASRSANAGAIHRR